MTSPSRRRFLAAGGTVLSAAWLSSCDALSTDPEGGEQANGDGGADLDVKQAPMLAESVEAGDLPPLEERLPRAPLVIEPVDRPGHYGGTWRAALIGTTPFWLRRSMGYETLLRWDIEFSEVIPNVARDFEVNDDGTRFTFTLREGMRWSDGEPFTTDDIVFWYESVLLNEELTPEGPPRWMTAGGEPLAVETVDDVTFTITFGEPNGQFLQRLATPEYPLLTQCPKHYLEQFHPDHNPNVDELVDEAGVADWGQLFASKGAGTDEFWSVADVPTLLPWRITTPIGESNRVIAERNPFYWKTDPHDRQLPYIDEVVNEVVNEQEVLVVKVLNGEIDMRSRDVAILSNKPTLADGREDGDYRFFDHVPTYMNKALIAFNLNHKDPATREVFNNKDFRIGLSHAIDRQELISTIYQRQGGPWQVAPREDSVHYHEQLATQYLEYDLELANEHLDRAGYTERDDEDFRLGPNGERIIVHLEAVNELRPELSEVADFLQTNWREVGIDARVRTQSRDLYITREQANDHSASVWIGDAGGDDASLDPRWYFPYGPVSAFAREWGTWYSSEGAEGEEPPEPAKRQMELYDQLKATLDTDEQADLMAQILDISAEEFYLVGTVKDPVGYGIVKNNFHNVPDSMLDSWMYPDPGPTMPEQYFIEEG